MKELLNIKYWLFDLDNTLYSGDTKVFDQVDKRMSKYISNKLKVSIDEARKIQKNYFHEYNTTLNGMIKNHEIDAKEFLDFVHDIDLEFLKKDKGLEQELSRIKDKKIYSLTAPVRMQRMLLKELELIGFLTEFLILKTQILSLNLLSKPTKD